MRQFYILPVISLLALSLAVSCQKQTDVEGDLKGEARFEVPADAPELTKGQLEMSDAVAGFGLKVFSDLLKKDDIIFSPMSLSMALSLCEMGAAGETSEQLAKILGFAGYTPQEVAAYYQAVVGRILSADQSVKLSSANALWVDNGFPVKSSYYRDLAKYFNAQAFNVDFSHGEAVKEQVNKWGSDHTAGKIPAILDSNPSAPMILANALYFNASWGVTFDEELKKAPFYGSNATKESDYFTKEGLFGFAQAEGAEFLSIPYGKGVFDFVAVLPDNGKTLQDALALLQSAKGEKILAGLSAANGIIEGLPVNVQIPCFEISTSTKQLDRLLASWGVTLPFTANADFSGISLEQPLYIGEIAQKATVTVNEKGSEAAVITDVGWASSPGPDSEPESIEFIANRPFLFLIRETGSNTILFIGAKNQA